MTLVMGLEVIRASVVDQGSMNNFLQGYLLQLALIEEEEFLLLARDAQQIGGFLVLRFYLSAPFQF